MKALGPEEQVEGQFLTHPLAAGDMLLLCTDGLYNSLQLEEMQRIMMQASDLQAAVDTLLELALRRGASDNLTVILYRHEPEQS